MNTIIKEKSQKPFVIHFWNVYFGIPFWIFENTIAFLLFPLSIKRTWIIIKF